ncbi:PQQ-binding-like beta-propeller repeat protein [Halomicrobium sp. LC1Hm]|uniref:outer membrane protein assembly factor BamB family protein n=1 Tax=Halomicrobium sp. LC1Hm TaxID=2610902 RepID=UPI0012A91625|nr:PQQ-binding-like beta-propeller repeat protein [Halomicrobium sp. LC1Hm]QGA83196.1 Secreted protein, with PKD repeat domain [Halomicrobium sp. LC1Hm]
MTDRPHTRRALLASLATVTTAGCLRSQANQEADTTTQRSTDGGQRQSTTAEATRTETGEPDLSSEAWPTFGADRTGRGTADVTGPGRTLDERWSVTFDSGAGDPAIASETVAVVGRTELFALDAATGERRWSFEIGLTDETSPAPTVQDGRVYATPGDGYAYALSTDGEFQWSTQLTDGNGSGVATPRPAGETLVIADQSRIAGVDPETGEEQWSATLEGTILGVVTDGEYAYAGVLSSDQSLVALDTATGDRVWSYDALENAHGPAVVDGRVYGGGAATLSEDDGTRDVGPVYALDAATGEEQWRAVVDANVATSPAVGEETVFVTDLDGRMSAFDRDSGESRWQTRLRTETLDSPQPLRTSASALVDGTLYVGTLDGRLVAVNADDGNVERAVDVGEIRCSPAVAGGHVLVGNTDGELTAFGTE